MRKVGGKVQFCEQGKEIRQSLEAVKGGGGLGGQQSDGTEHRAKDIQENPPKMEDDLKLCPEAIPVCQGILAQNGQHPGILSKHIEFFFF